MHAAGSLPSAPADAAPAVARPAPERLVWLDALRFFAIMGVMVVHVAYAFPALGRHWVLGLGAGRYGVDLFFAISGFLFCALMLGRRMEPWRYLCRRYLRIAAVYYAAMLLYAWLRPAHVRWGTVGINVAFLNAWSDGGADYLVPGGWSICAEVFFYAAGILLLPLLRSRRGAWGCWAGALALAAMLAARGRGLAIAGDYSPLINLPTFLGGVLCWYYRDRAPAGAPAAAIVAVGFAAVVTASAAAVPMPPRFVTGAVCAIACWASIRLLNWPVLAGLGRLSYSVYAFHFAVLEAAVVLAVAVLPVDAPVWQPALLVLGLVVAGSFPIAWGIVRYLETPVSRLLRARSA